MSEAAEGGKGKNIATWVLCGLVGLAFVAAGGNKLANPADAAEMFAGHFGLPAGLAVFIGTCEVAGGIGVLIPRLSTWAASGLVLIMIGAAYQHITTDPLANAVAPLVLGALSAGIAYLRKNDALFIS